jgi:hypothetical protein
VFASRKSRQPEILRAIQMIGDLERPSLEWRMENASGARLPGNFDIRIGAFPARDADGRGTGRMINVK